jgi:D-aminopeptidase
MRKRTKFSTGQSSIYEGIMKLSIITIFSLSLVFGIGMTTTFAQKKQRIRDLGIKIGILPTGKWNAITDVDGVKVGHTTLLEGKSIRTGVTIILPHDGNLFREKVPAAIYVGNGFGKLLGKIQVEELGELETPIALTNTLNVFRVADALIDYTLSLPGNEHVRSINPVVGETNDGSLNDIQKRSVNKEHVMSAIQSAQSGQVAEGNVGAGTGTICFGFKGGIGTSSRKLPEDLGGYTVGVLAQTNFGGVLQINGVHVGEKLGKYPYKRQLQGENEGSCAMVVATDAPLSARNLKRIAKRALLGLARTGGYMSNGSGDYVIAFSNYKKMNRDDEGNQLKYNKKELSNDRMSPLFLAVVEATEEAIYNALFKSETMTGYRGRTVQSLPIDQVVPWLKSQ